jgi:hypothetical protein
MTKIESVSSHIIIYEKEETDKVLKPLHPILIKVFKHRFNTGQVLNTDVYIYQDILISNEDRYKNIDKTFIKNNRNELKQYYPNKRIFKINTIMKDIFKILNDKGVPSFTCTMYYVTV